MWPFLVKLSAQGTLDAGETTMSRLKERPDPAALLPEQGVTAGR